MMLCKLLTRILPRVCSMGAKRSSVLLSLASVYLWDEEGINRQDFNHTVREFWRMYRDHHVDGLASVYRSSTKIVHDSEQSGDQDVGAAGLEEAGDDLCDEGWEAVIVQEHFQVFRKLVSGSSYLYQYKIFGTYRDIPAKAFFLVQLDTNFRKVWDKLVVKLDVVDSELRHGSDPDYQRLIDESDGFSFDTKNQVVQWVMHYPYPMYSREYCYVRRAVVDRRKNLMILVSKSTSHPSCGKSNEYVRVSAYDSRLVIRPHADLNDNGFDYLLMYFDDPQSSFPSAAYNWMAYSGVPDFVNKLHDAAVRLNNEILVNGKKEKERRAGPEDVVFTLEDKNSNHREEPKSEKQSENDEIRTKETHSDRNNNSITASNATKVAPAPAKTAARPVTALAASPRSCTGASIRVDAGHSVFHGWSSFFSR